MTRVRIHWNVMARGLAALALTAAALYLARQDGDGWHWLQSALCGVAVGVAQGPDNWWHLEKRAGRTQDTGHDGHALATSECPPGPGSSKAARAAARAATAAAVDAARRKRTTNPRAEEAS